MIDGDCDQRAHALIERDQIDWMGDGVLCQLVTIELVHDLDLLEPAVCVLPPRDARGWASALLELAEQAERLTRRAQP
jgi:hypothetical protein